MSKPQAKPKPKGNTWIKPGFVMAAITLAWAGANTPPDFSATDTGVWIAGMLTVALITKAALAIIEPIVKLMLHTGRRQIRDAKLARHNARNNAHHNAAKAP